MVNTFPGPEVLVKGKNMPDAIKRSDILAYLQNNLETEELAKLKKMASKKGRETLKKKWSLISIYI